MINESLLQISCPWRHFPSQTIRFLATPIDSTLSDTLTRDKDRFFVIPEGSATFYNFSNKEIIVNTARLLSKITWNIFEKEEGNDPDVYFDAKV